MTSHSEDVRSMILEREVAKKRSGRQARQPCPVLKTATTSSVNGSLQGIINQYIGVIFK